MARDPKSACGPSQRFLLLDSVGHLCTKHYLHENKSHFHFLGEICFFLFFLFFYLKLWSNPNHYTKGRL